MATISAKDVAALRKATGIGMMECKKALVEAEGDADKALKILRERGLAVAAKKESRIAAEGVVDILKEGNATAIIEVNSETDFVAKNASFKEFVKTLLQTVIAARPASVEELMAANYAGTDLTVDAKLAEMRFTIGEKITIRRFAVVDGITGTYVHHDSSTAVVVSYEADDAAVANAGFAAFAKNIALQIAGNTPAPTYVSRDEVPASVLEEEINIQVTAMKNDPKNASKPDAILQKIVAGKMDKLFYANTCLLDQAYILDDDLSVAKYIAQSAKELGGKIAVKSFIIYNKGEGLEKREDNFADEIAKLTNKA